MNAHAAIKNTFLEDFFVQKCLTIIPMIQPINFQRSSLFIFFPYHNAVFLIFDGVKYES